MRVVSLLVLACVVICRASIGAPDCRGMAPKDCATEAINREDYGKAYLVLLGLANKGDAESQMGVALLIANGHGDARSGGASTEERKILALPWIRKAAIGGNKQATSWLADGFKYGWFGFPVSQEKESCLRRAADSAKSAALCLSAKEAGGKPDSETGVIHKR